MADQLVPIPLVTPGFKGLNSAQSSVPDLDPGWATACVNFIMDQRGRLAARQGWTALTGVQISGAPPVASIGELALANGSTFIVSAANNKLYSGTTSLSFVTGSLTITADNWQWVTFNGAIYGIQAGHPLIKWNGTGTFATITPTSGTVPSGGSCGLAAFGRLWIVNADGQTISYCNLLDDSGWAVTGAGSINMATVWTRGIDTIVGLGAAGSKLVIFGTKQIVVYADNTGAINGLNPANLYVYDTIEGTGLAARDTIQSTGEGDLTFLSPTGVQSLQRLLTSGRDQPVAALDAQIHDYFNGYFLLEDPATVRSVYSPTNRFYLILLPVAQRIFCYDTRVKLQDGSLRVTEWSAITWRSLLNRKNNNVLVGQLGLVGQYGGYTDNGATYTVSFASPNLALSPNYENHQKILKRMKAVIYFEGPTSAVFSWSVDFGGLVQTYTVPLVGLLSEFGTAQYGINEYGGGAGTTIQGFPLSNAGRWLQFGFSAVVNGFTVAIQQLDAFVKIGNLA